MMSFTQSIRMLSLAKCSVTKSLPQSLPVKSLHQSLLGDKLSHQTVSSLFTLTHCHRTDINTHLNNGSSMRTNSNPSTRSLSTSEVQRGLSDYYYIKKAEAGKFTKPKMWEVPQYLLDRAYWRHQRKGGRGEDGRIKIRHMGGGHQRNLRIVDHMRVGPSMPGVDDVLVRDRVISVGYDPFRSGHIALVIGSGMDQPKLILAPHKVQAGDILTAHRGPPESLIKIRPGDAYPLEHLPLNTVVHNMEQIPGGGGVLARSAGTGYTLRRKNETTVVLEQANKAGKNKTSYELPKECLAVVGRVSNPEHNTRKIGKAGRSRWLNKRPKGQTGKDRWHHRPKDK